MHGVVWVQTYTEDSEMRWMHLYLPVQFGSPSLDEHMLEQRDTIGTFATVPIEK